MEQGSSAAPDDSFTVVVGWSSENLGSRIVLKMQSVRAPSVTSENDIRTSHYFMTKSQAALLANYLFEVSGQAPPRRRKRGWLERLLGR